MKLSLRMMERRCSMIDEAIFEVKRLERRIAGLEKENFHLSAGQCVIKGGVISDKYGHKLCQKEVEQ